jgi:hypothetical protein
MRSRRRLLLKALLLPIAPLCGCRSAPIEFDFWDGIIDGVVDSAFDAIDGDETPEEESRESEQRWRESRGL